LRLAALVSTIAGFIPLIRNLIRCHLTSLPKLLSLRTMRDSGTPAASRVTLKLYQQVAQR
jgi:hypothetical protein